MKTQILILLAGFSMSMHAQTASDKGTINAEKQTTATAADQIKKANGAETGKPDRSAGAGGSLTVANSKEKKSTQKRQIPDGSYGTNRTGLIYSPENPNYPYDKNGNLIKTPGTEIISGRNRTANNSSQLQGDPREPSTKL